MCCDESGSWIEMMKTENVGVELSSDSKLQYCRQKEEAREGLQVAHDFRVESRFLGDKGVGGGEGKCQHSKCWRLPCFLLFPLPLLLCVTLSGS